MNPTPEERASSRPRALPPSPNFDTLKVSESLKKAKFGDRQAMTLVEIIQDAQAGLATKADLERMETGTRNDMEKLETGIRHDMEKLETGIRNDMEKMGAGIRKDMEAGFHHLEKMVLNLRGDMEAGFQKIIWFLLSSIIAATIAATGIISAVILYGGA